MPRTARTAVRSLPTTAAAFLLAFALAVTAVLVAGASIAGSDGAGATWNRKGDSTKGATWNSVEAGATWNAKPRNGATWN